MITAKIDVTKIDKARLFKGKKGTYLDLILIETPNGQYGDYMIKQSISKEEREQGVEMPIIGNAQNRGGSRSAAPKPQHAKPNTGSDVDEDVPF
jgi:hypothetical protein